MNTDLTARDASRSAQSHHPRPVGADPGNDAGPNSETRYERVSRLIATDQAVIMDGATGTELIRVAASGPSSRSTCGA